MLDALALRRAGGQRKLALGEGGGGDGTEPLLPIVERPVGQEDVHPGEAGPEAETGPAQEPPPSAEEARDDSRALPSSEAEAGVGSGSRKRRGHLGVRIDFESRPEDPELGRLVESTIWVNEAHPAYQRALASRLQAYHLAITVAITLAPLAVESRFVHDFVSRFLERWGKVDAAKRR